jgi:hypothetical protein
MFQKETFLFRNRTRKDAHSSLIKINHQIISKAIAFLFCVSFFVLLPAGFSGVSKAEAATYYVSKTATNGYTIGNDTGNDGISKSTPFLSIYKAYTVAVSNQDTIYVNDGTYNASEGGNPDTFFRIEKGITLLPENAGQVTLTASAGGGLVVYAKLLSSASATIGAINLDAGGVAYASGSVYINPQGANTSFSLIGTSLINQKSYGIYCAYTANGYNLTIRNIHISGTDTTYHAIYLSGIVGGIVDIDGVDLNWSINGNLRYGIYIKAGSAYPTVNIKHIIGTVQNVTGASAGVEVRNVPNALIENCNLNSVSSINVNMSNGDAIGLKIAADAGLSANGGVIRNNIVNCTMKSGYCIAIGDSGASGGTVNNGQIYGNTATATNLWDQTITPHGIIMGMGNATLTSGGVVYGNTATNFAPNYLAAKCDSTVIFHDNVSVDSYGLQGLYSKGSTGIQWLNNTIYLHSGYNGVVFAAQDHGDGTHNSNPVYKNNVVYNLNTAAPKFVRVTSNNTAIFDDNVYWSLTPSDSGSFIYPGVSVNSFSSWQSAGFDIHSSLIDPQIGTDYKLAYSSPAIDSGTPISGLTTDYLNHHIYGTPDIGAYEYQPPYTIGTDNPNITSPIRIYADGKYRYTSTTSGSSVAKLSIAPSGGFGTGDYSQWMDVTVNTWHTSSDYYKSWTETSSNSALVTNHTIGDLKPNTYYTLKLETVNQTTYLSNGTGQITFTYSGGYSTNHTFELTEDTTPPTNIAISSITPDSSTQLTITAQTATDSESGLNSAPYWFHETSGNPGALSSSVWQTSTTFINTGLSPNTEYSYQVKAKDANNNESTYSTILSKYTLSTIPSSPLLSSPTLSSIKVTVNQNSNPSNTTYAIYESTTSRYVQADGTLNTTPIWQTYVSWGGNQGIQVISLSHNVQYTFEVKARNGDNTETSLSPSSSLYTTASISPSNFTTTSINTNSNTLTVDRFNNDTVSNAGYLFTNTTNSHTSNWIQTNTWQDTNLTPNTNYTYTVRYRNSQSVETTDATISFHTLAPTPTTLTITSLPLTTTLSTDIFPNSTDNQSGYLFTNTTNSHTSNWIQTNTWQDTNLNCYTTYTYTLKYRNADGTETSPITATKSTTGCGTPFTPPIKPDISNTKIIATNSGLITIDNLPATITQIAVSTTQDFKNSSWQDIKDLQTILNKYINTIKLYFKFKTKDGGVSDTIIYTPTNTPTIPLTEGDIVKTIDNPDVYIIKYKNSKQYKRLILSPNVFKSYQHLKWTNLKIISQEQLNQYTTSNLVQLSGDTNIYSLTPYGDEGERRIQNTIQLYDQDSVYEINKTDRDSYKLVK